MYPYRNLIVFFVCLVLARIGIGANIDSLETELDKANQQEQIDLLITLSKAYWSISPKKGLTYADSATFLAQKHEEKYKQARALLYGGVNNWFMGSYDLAIEYFHKSLAIADSIHNTDLCGFNFNNLGMVYTEIKEYDLAIVNYKEASKLVKKQGNEIEYAKIVNNIAELKARQGNYDEALSHQLEILPIIENSNERVFLIWLLCGIGEVYFKKDNLNEAKRYFLESLKVSNKIEEIVGKSIIFNHIGNVYLKKKEYKKANEYYLKGLIIAQKTDSKEYIKKIYKNLSALYEKMGNYKQALEYYKQYKIASDTVLNNDKVSYIVKIRSEYEMEKKEKENDLLRQNNEIKQLTIQKQNHIRNFFIVLFVLAVAIIILIYSRFTTKRRINRELKEKNKLITEQKNQLAEANEELKVTNQKLEGQKKEIQAKADELVAKNKELKILNATKDKFFSIIAHDLRGPFNSMLGFSNLLTHSIDSFDKEKQKEFIDIINQGLKNTYKLLENLLYWAKIQRNTIDFNPQKTELTPLLNEVINTLELTALNKSISIRNRISDNIILEVDKNMLSSVIRNLLSNAIKFTPQKGEIDVFAQTIKDEMENKFFEMKVKDNGVGMEEERCSKLFDISENTSTRGTNDERGTGLGLILCKEFIDKHHGKISVKSKVGEGSEFVFTIPLNQK